MKAAEQEVARLEAIYDADPHPSNREALHESQAHLFHHLACEEIFWRQKSRVKWLQEGDKNTSFFHQSVMANRAKLHIHKLQDDEGNWITDPTAMGNLAVDFYKKLFSADSDHCAADSPLFDCIPSFVIVCFK